MKSTSVDDDPADGRTWIKANPSLKESGGFLDKEKIRQQYVSHQAEADLSSFKRYFLNNWGQKERRAIDMNLWRACRRDWDASGWLLPPRRARPVRQPQVLAGPRYLDDDGPLGTSGGVPRDDGGYDVLPVSWMPEATLARRQVQDGVPHARWAEAGWVETGEGRVIDNGLIKARIRYCLEMFDVQEVCFDRYNSREVSTIGGNTAIQYFHGCGMRVGVTSRTPPSAGLPTVPNWARLRPQTPRNRQPDR